MKRVMAATVVVMVFCASMGLLIGGIAGAIAGAFVGFGIAFILMIEPRILERDA